MDLLCKTTSKSVNYPRDKEFPSLPKLADDNRLIRKVKGAQTSDCASNLIWPNLILSAKSSQQSLLTPDQCDRIH